MIVYHVLSRKTSHYFYTKMENIFPFDEYDIKLNVIKIKSVTPLEKEINENDFSNYISTPSISKTSI